MDPVGIDTYRNTQLTELIYPIPPYPMKMRYRYLSFFTWVLEKTHGSVFSICNFEKIFLLANLLYIKRFSPSEGSLGLPGSSRDFEKILSTEHIPLNSFNIHKGGGCGFYAYYSSQLQKYSLAYLDEDKLKLTPLGHKLAKIFEKNTKLDFNEIGSYVSSGVVPREYLESISERLYVGLLTAHKDLSDEREFLKRVLFYLIDFKLSKTAKDSYESLQTISGPVGCTKKSNKKTFTLIAENEAQVLKEIKKRGILENARCSMTLFLWYISKYQEFRDDPHRTQIIPPERIQNIHDKWREVVFQEFMSYALEGTLYSLTSPIFMEMKLEDVLYELISEEFEKTVNELMSKKQPGEESFLEFFRRGIYFRENTLTTDQEPAHRAPIYLYTPIKKITENFRELPLSAWVFPNEINYVRYIQKHARNLKSTSDASRIIAATISLYLILTARTTNKDYPVPLQIHEETFEKFSKRFLREIMYRHIEVSYRKAPNHGWVPPFFFTIEDGYYKYVRPYVGSVGPTTTKYERILDILYETGLVSSRRLSDKNLSLTEDGYKFLKELMGG